MGNIAVTEFLSLDGVMEAPHEWHYPFFNEKMGMYKFNELMNTDALLLGRVTYDGFAEAWPQRSNDDEFTARMNSLPKFVVSTTLETADWNNSHIIKQNVREEVAKLKQQFDRDIVIHGSAALTNSLMQDDLIDEFRLMIHPVIVGHGKRLFQDGQSEKPLKLTDSIIYDNGAMVLTYQPAR